MMLYRRDPTEWAPREACGPGKQTSDLTVGQIVVWERRPYRVAEVTPCPLTDWSPKRVEAWTGSGRPDPQTWRGRPIVVVLTPQFKNGVEEHLEASADYPWLVLPQHYSVCRLCLEIPPCRHEWEESVLRHARVELDAAMRILPGACHECKDPVRPRQATIRFEGPNLIRPDLGDDSVVFHARGKCRAAAYRYDERWAAAEPGRRKKLSCDGMAIRHRDGTFECTAGPGCPMGVDGAHRGGSMRCWPAPDYECWCLADATVAEGAEA